MSALSRATSTASSTRDADIGCMQGRRIIDAIADISDRVPGFLQSTEISAPSAEGRFQRINRSGKCRPQRLILDFSQIVAGQREFEFRPEPLPLDELSRGDLLMA